MIDLHLLAGKIDSANLMQKKFYDMSTEEVKKLAQYVYESTEPDCCYHYICVQVPTYIARCTGQEKCKRLLYFAQNKIPKSEAKSDRP